jgi:hypothetical protein
MCQPSLQLFRCDSKSLAILPECFTWKHFVRFQGKTLQGGRQHRVLTFVTSTDFLVQLESGGADGTDDASFRSWHYWLVATHRIGQHDHMKPCYRHKLPEIDAQFKALWHIGASTHPGPGLVAATLANRSAWRR